MAPHQLKSPPFPVTVLNHGFPCYRNVRRRRSTVLRRVTGRNCRCRTIIDVAVSRTLCYPAYPASSPYSWGDHDEQIVMAGEEVGWFAKAARNISCISTGHVALALYDADVPRGEPFRNSPYTVI